MTIQQLKPKYFMLTGIHKIQIKMYTFILDLITMYLIVSYKYHEGGTKNVL